jgi:hypothetical protein
MSKIKRLLDIYRFPGFLPYSSLRGVFGDHRAVVIQLRRRQKKQSAASVAKSNFAITTSALGKCVTFPVETDASIWNTKEDALIARGVRP